MDTNAPVLLVGLGNPGASYARNRHNIGFMAVDAIHDDAGLGPWRSKFHAAVADGRIGNRRVFALKPQTYMNESGRAVQAAMAFLKTPPANVWVFHDELDLAAGKVRTKTGGGHAGHNGLRSIHAAIGADYGRVRLGIGHPGDKARVTGHVLGDFAKADADWLHPLTTALARHVDLLIAGRESDYMSKVAMDAPAPAPRGAQDKDD
jgi:PTH1 family peptidyl-tRNA hydrolase